MANKQKEVTYNTMKNKIRYNRILFILVLACTLTACKSNKKASDSADSSLTEDSLTAETISDNESDNSEAGIRKGNYEDIDVSLLTEEEKLYWEFLCDKGVLVETPLSDRMLSSEGSYDLEGLLNNLAKNNDNFSNCHIGDVGYAFIDCGLDGEKELAIVCKLYNDTVENDYMPCIFVVKAYDEKLSLIDVETSYGKYNTVMNQAGYIVYGGDANEKIHHETIKYIDKDGVVNHVYTKDTNTGLKNAEIPDDYLPDDMLDGQEWTDSEKYFECDVYNFEEYYWHTIKDYDDEYKKYMDNYRKGYLFSFRDQSGDSQMPDEEECKKYDENGLKYLDGQEMEDVLNSRNEELGITDDIINADVIKWSSL